MDIIDVVLREHRARVEHVNREAFEHNLRQPVRKFGYASGIRSRALTRSKQQTV